MTTIMNPTCPGMPGERRRKRMVIRQHKGGVVEWMMIPTMMIWARRGTCPATGLPRQ